MEEQKSQVINCLFFNKNTQYNNVLRIFACRYITDCDCVQGLLKRRLLYLQDIDVENSFSRVEIVAHVTSPPCCI